MSAPEPPLPRARRLNRNAAIVALTAGCVMVLVVTFLMTSAPTIGDHPPPPLPSEAEPQAPAFLERAPVPPPASDADRTALLGTDGRVTPLPAPPPTAPLPWVPDEAYAVPPAGGTAPGGTDPSAAGEQRAKAAGILAGEAAPRPMTSVDAPDAPAGAAAPAGGQGARRLTAEVQPPGAGYEVPAGTAIPVVLVSAVDSDAPGEVVAMVTHDVYDRGMRAVLIPRATRLLGHPVGGAVLGQRRLSLVWERLLLPDGRTVVLAGVPSQDATGAAGLAARVDNHTGSVLRSALLLSAVGAGAQLSQPQQSATYGQAPSVGQTMAAAAGQELAQVSGEMIRRGLDVRPTLSLPQGTRLQVLLTGDLALEPAP